MKRVCARQGCNNTFVPRKQGRPQIYCSQNCGNAARAAADPERYAEYIRRGRENAKRKRNQKYRDESAARRRHTKRFRDSARRRRELAVGFYNSMQILQAPTPKAFRMIEQIINGDAVYVGISNNKQREAV